MPEPVDVPAAAPDADSSDRGGAGPAGRTVVRLADGAHLAMLAHAYDGYPYEACGLLGGSAAEGTIEVFVPCRNVDESARTYSIGPDGFLAAERALDAAGLDLVGVMHSHTHTDAYPSPTDVDKADNPLLEGWHYVIVSLRDISPVVRCYRLDGREVVEEALVPTSR